jgi:CubicO group peptidase (beta-lactamase class C family)
MLGPAFVIRRPVIAALLVTAFMLSACAGPGARDNAALNAERMHQALVSLERQGFAGQVVVMQGDRVLLNRGYGHMGPEDPRPITPEAVMPLASLTKPFTASAVLALAAEGRLGLDDPIGDHLPALDPTWSAVPIRHFLTHTAGLPAEIINRSFDGEPRFEPIGRDTFLDRLARFEPDHPPGDGFNYSNVGYNLLAVLIEKLAEESFEDFLTGSLLATAGVSDIGLLRPGFCRLELVAGRATGQDSGHYFDQPMLADGFGWHLRGAGDLMGRPRGLIAWWLSIRRQTWLSQPWLDLWLTPQVSEADGSRYGYGLHFRDTRFGPAIGHTGGDFTFAVDFSWFTDHDVMVYIASADARYEADLIRDDLHRLLLAR